MLFSIGILTSVEFEQLKKGLSILEKQIHEGTFIIETQFEDVHSKIEFELTNMYGEVGKKIHTARSRNDQVLVATRLFAKEQLINIKNQNSQGFNKPILGLDVINSIHTAKAANKASAVKAAEAMAKPCLPDDLLLTNLYHLLAYLFRGH